jgi:predicted metal-dependent hydrolase
VILHELAHLRVRGHGPDFKAILDLYMPDWKARKKLLNG